MTRRARIGAAVTFSALTALTAIASRAEPARADPPPSPPGPAVLPYSPSPAPLYEAPPLPATLPYEDGQSVPRGYRLTSRPTRSLLLAGALSFGVAYLSAGLSGAAYVGGGIRTGGAYAPLFAPVVGPFITLGTAPSGAGTPLLVLDGLAQLGGMSLLVCGAAIDEKLLLRTGTSPPRFPDAWLHPTVLASGRSFGLRWAM